MTTSERVAIRPGNKKRKEKKASEADQRQEWIKSSYIMKKKNICDAGC